MGAYDWRVWVTRTRTVQTVRLRAAQALPLAQPLCRCVCIGFRTERVQYVVWRGTAPISKYSVLSADSGAASIITVLIPCALMERPKRGPHKGQKNSRKLSLSLANLICTSALAPLTAYSPTSLRG